MKRPGFFEGVLVAVVVSVAASAIFTSFRWLVGSGEMELIITAISFGYLLYLLARSSEKTGRIVVSMTWFVFAALLYFLSPSLVVFVLVHVAVLWLVRSLYFYSSVLSALTDLALNIVSLVVGVWAAVHTNSLFLCIWCFFLLQALFVFIPARFDGQVRKRTFTEEHENTFEHAHRTAELALRKLSSIQ